PMPLLLPVTRATLPSSLPMIAPRSKGSPRWWGHRAPAPPAGDDLTILEHRGEVGDALWASEPPSRGRAPVDLHAPGSARAWLRQTARTRATIPGWTATRPPPRRDGSPRQRSVPLGSR